MLKEVLWSFIRLLCAPNALSNELVFGPQFVFLGLLCNDVKIVCRIATPPFDRCLCFHSTCGVVHSTKARYVVFIAWEAGFSTPGWGWSIESPKTGGGGGSGKGFNRQHHSSVILHSGAKGAENFLSIENGAFFFHQIRGK